MVINTNLSAMAANTQALRIGGAVGQHLERLSTGLKINRGEDDPSGLGMARKTQAQIRGTNVAIHNIEESIYYYNMRDALMAEDQDMVQRIRDLAVRGANDATLTDAQRLDMQAELSGLMQSINSIALASPKVGGPSHLLWSPTRLDVIWVMDATASMIPAADKLYDAAGQMFDEFNAAGFDLRMNITPFAVNIFQSWGVDNVSWGFQTSAVGFRNDVSEVRDMITAGTGGRENGLISVNSTIDNASLGGAFRTGTDVKRVIILVTDEDSDDFVQTNVGDHTANADPLNIRGALVNKLVANDITLHFVGKCRYEGDAAERDLPDDDYGLVASDPAVGGKTIPLTDASTAWVTDITNTLKANAADWDAEYQVGPDSAQHLIYTFSSVTTGTMGLDSANVTTQALAEQSITIANDAIEWISNERAETGIAVKRLQHIANDLAAMNIGNSGFKSGLEDADMQEEFVNITIQNMLSNTVTAAQAQANANPESASAFLSTVENAEQVGQYGRIFTVQKAM